MQGKKMWKLFLIILVSVITTSEGLCCNYGTSASSAAKSCMDVIRLSPGCKDLSGYYWLETTNGSSVQVYCDMSSRGGGWERIAYHNSELSTSCPGNMGNYRLGSFLVCTNNNGSSNITSAQYTPVTQSYSQVMGLMTGYISGAGFGFRPQGLNIKNFNKVYMDGISLGIEDNSGFIKHVFSSVATEYSQSYSVYPCYVIGQDLSFPPSIVGADHTCTVMRSYMFMALDGTFSNGFTQFFGDMWDGSCDVNDYYCRHILRYFIKILPNEMNSADNPLSVRVVSQDQIIVGLNFLDIYVR